MGTNLLAQLAKYGSRKWLAAIIGNLILALFGRFLVGQLSKLSPTFVWLGLALVGVLAIGIWVYIFVEGKLDLERLRRTDPITRAREALAVYQQAVKDGVEPDHALTLIQSCLDQNAIEFAEKLREN